MFIKLLVGPAASGKSTYIENHKSEDDIIGFTIFDKLIIEDQHIAYKLQYQISLMETFDSNQIILSIN